MKIVLTTIVMFQHLEMFCGAVRIKLSAVNERPLHTHVGCMTHT